MNEIIIFMIHYYFAWFCMILEEYEWLCMTFDDFVCFGMIIWCFLWLPVIRMRETGHCTRHKQIMCENSRRRRKSRPTSRTPRSSCAWKSTSSGRWYNFQITEKSLLFRLEKCYRKAGLSRSEPRAFCQPFPEKQDCPTLYQKSSGKLPHKAGLSCSEPRAFQRKAGLSRSEPRAICQPFTEMQDCPALNQKLSGSPFS